MPKSVLSRGRKFVARLTALAMVASLMVIGAAPASAAIDTSTACPASTASAGFTDIGGFDATTQNAINCLVAYEISNGTSATTFSPAGEVSRWQMALFLTRQAEVHGLTLPSGAAQDFTDIGSFNAETQTAINQLAQLDITQGTSATTFSPNDVVTRWQMALFLTRLAEAAGLTLPSGADQGFTDIAGLEATTQTAINQAKQLGIADGTSATTYNPMASTLRWQMALFLTRTLAAGGVTPQSTGFIVTAVVGNQVSYADTNQNKIVTVAVTTSNTFTVGGQLATQGAFLAAATAGDLLTLGGAAQYNLTNRTAADYTSGPIGLVDVGTTSFSIVEPISGASLASYDYTATAFIVLSSDGSAVSAAAFEGDISIGDTVAITGTGANASNIRTIALTNQTVTGTVSDVDGGAVGNFNVAPWTSATDDLNAVAGDTLTVDGSSVAEGAFETALSTGDSVTYAKKGGIQTIALTNAAAASISGKVLNNDGIGANTVDVDGALAETYANLDTVFIVNGALDDEAGFEARLTAGDDITIVRADGVVNSVDRVTLTDRPFSGTPETIDSALNTVTVTFKTGGGESEAIAYGILTPDVGLTGTGEVVYSIPGNSDASELQFEAALSNAAVNGGNVSVALVGTDIVWTVTS